MLTSLADELLAIEAVRAGAQDYLIRGKINGNVPDRLRYAIERKRIETTLRARNQQLTVVTQQLWQKARLALAADEPVISLIRELNNPLAAVSGQLESLWDSLQRRIQVEIECMGKLVADLLQASVQNTDHPAIELPDLLQYLHTPVMPATETEEKRFFEALGAWAAGYILRSAAVTPHGLKNYLRQLEKRGCLDHGPLSPREREVVYLVASGHTNKEIARCLSLSVRTVERHTTSIMNKLGLHKRAELIAYAIREGIVSGGEIGSATD